MADIPQEVLGVEENRCLQEVHLEHRKMRELRMGRVHRVLEQGEAGGLEMVNPVRKRNDVMPQLSCLGPWRAQEMMHIRQYCLVHEILLHV